MSDPNKPTSAAGFTEDDREAIAEWKRFVSAREGQPYASCGDLLGTLVFDTQQVTACCFSRSGRGWPPLASFRGGALPVSEIIRSRIEIIEENQGEGFRHCKGCVRLQEGIWSPRPYVFDRILVANSRNCNLRCQYCSIGRGEADTTRFYPIRAIVSGLLKDGIMDPNGSMDWGGGEPIIYPEFDEIIGDTLDYGVRHLVHTNATRCSPTLLTALEKNLARLDTSIDAGTRETYFKIKKRDEFDHVWDNLERYAATGGRVVGKFIFMEENFHEAHLFVEEAARRGVRNLCYDIDLNCESTSGGLADAVGNFVIRARELGLRTEKGAFIGQVLSEERGRAVAQALERAQAAVSHTDSANVKDADSDLNRTETAI